MKSFCVHCGQPTEATPSPDGMVVCPACGKTSHAAMPSGDSSPPAAPSGGAVRAPSRFKRRDLLILAGVALAVLVLLLLFLRPRQEGINRLVFGDLGSGSPSANPGGGGGTLPAGGGSVGPQGSGSSGLGVAVGGSGTGGSSVSGGTRNQAQPVGTDAGTVPDSIQKQTGLDGDTASKSPSLAAATGVATGGPGGAGSGGAGAGSEGRGGVSGLGAGAPGNGGNGVGGPGNGSAGKQAGAGAGTGSAESGPGTTSSSGGGTGAGLASAASSPGSPGGAAPASGAGQSGAGSPSGGASQGTGSGSPAASSGGSAAPGASSAGASPGAGGGATAAQGASPTAGATPQARGSAAGPAGGIGRNDLTLPRPDAPPDAVAKEKTEDILETGKKEDPAAKNGPFDPQRGTNIVFVLDRSLSMSQDGKSTAARRALVNALNALDPNKKFYVLFFPYEEMPAPAPIPATPENVRAMSDWLNSVGHADRSDPAQALLRGLRFTPDTVWLLSDGQFSPALAETIRGANGDLKAQINTIGFYSRDGEPVLRQIAQENHGTYHFVPRPDKNSGAGSSTVPTGQSPDAPAPQSP
jgi:hypothetical protein